MAKLFPGLEADIGERSNDEVPATAEVVAELGAPNGRPDDETDGTDSTPVAGTAEELLDQADQLLREADEQLAAGDLGAYQQRVDDAGTFVAQALALLEDEATPATSVPG